MSHRVSVGILAVAAVIIGYWWYALVWHSLFLHDDYVRVHFLDVGQGDAILIETPNNHQVLVDAGRGIRVLSALDEVLPAHDRNIDIAVMTHPDADHIGGFVPVFRQYDVGIIMQSFIPSKTKLYGIVQDAVKNEKVGDKHAEVYTISRTYLFSLDGVRFDILWPIGKEVEETNAASIVLLVTYGEMEILLTGDAPSAVEDFLVEMFAEKLEDIEILKAGHQGSKTSTSETFLTRTKPNAIIYSFGKRNSYGHPDEMVEERVGAYSAAHSGEGLTEHRTADGTVSVLCDKKKFHIV